MKTFYLQLLTPERKFFEGEVQMLVLTTINGEIGIMAGHIPMVSAVAIGSVKVLIDGVWKEAANSDGFIEITPIGVIVLAQTMEWPEEISEDKVKKAMSAANEELKHATTTAKEKVARSGIARASARLKVIEKSRKNNRNI